RSARLADWTIGMQRSSLDAGHDLAPHDAGPQPRLQPSPPDPLSQGWERGRGVRAEPHAVVPSAGDMPWKRGPPPPRAPGSGGGDRGGVGEEWMGSWLEGEDWL